MKFLYLYLLFNRNTERLLRFLYPLITSLKCSYLWESLQANLFKLSSLYNKGPLLVLKAKLLPD